MLSTHFVDQLTEIEDALRLQWVNRPLSELCSRENGHLEDLVFNLPDVVQNELDRMCLAFRSTVFCKIWKQDALKVKEIEMKNIVEDLFQPALRATSTTLKSLFDQSITLKAVNKFFQDFNTEKADKDIENELSTLTLLLCPDGSTLSEYEAGFIQSVANKVCNFFKLQANRRKSTNIIELGKTLKLEGDFEILEEIGNEVLLMLFSFIFVVIIQSLVVRPAN